MPDRFEPERAKPIEEAPPTCEEMLRNVGILPVGHVEYQQAARPQRVDHRSHDFQRGKDVFDDVQADDSVERRRPGIAPRKSTNSAAFASCETLTREAPVIVRHITQRHVHSVLHE